MTMSRWGLLLACSITVLLMTGSTMSWLYGHRSSVELAWPDRQSVVNIIKVDDKLSHEDKLLVQAIKDHRKDGVGLHELPKEQATKEIEEARKEVHEKLEQEYQRMVDNAGDRLLREIKTNGDLEPSKGKILILTGGNNESQTTNKTRFAQIQTNRQEYANYHGYTYQFIDTTPYEYLGGPPAWGKVPAIKKVFKENKDVEWVWWLDMDGLIMNAEIDLAKHILNPRVLEERITWGRPVRGPDYDFVSHLHNKTDVNVEDIDIVMTHDKMGWNAGSMFLKRSKTTDMILSLWDTQSMRSQDWRQNEQTALTYLAFQSPEIFKRIGTIPQRLCNSYYYLPYKPGDIYEAGDFVIHFAGNIKKDRTDFDDIWDATYASRTRPPRKYQVE